MAVETIAIYVDDVLKTDNEREVVPIDGIQFRTVKLQVTDGLGQPATGNGEVVCLEPSAVSAINTLDGNLNADGAFEFILGPDVR